MNKTELLIIAGATVYGENENFSRSALVIKDKLIIDIIAADEVKKYPAAKVLQFPETFHCVPGFIDVHIHGTHGKDIMDASDEAFTAISQALAAEGTTSYLATTMTASRDDIEKVLTQVAAYKKTQDKVIGAELLGIHLEGPFISPDKVGAQSCDFILDPDIELIKRWQALANQQIKLLTLAPELNNSAEFIDALKQLNIIASIGHTNATYAETLKGIAAGCQHVTHLFNAMRGIHQREPGVVTAALLNNVFAEMIVDGVHLHPAIVEMILRLKGKDKLVLVTDAMRAKCLRDGEYDLGGQPVQVKKGIATLKDGTLAGSTLKMSDAIRNMLQYTSCELRDVVQMASWNPAKLLGIENQKGSLAKNKDADVVVLDESYNVVMTMCAGKIIQPN